MAEQGRSDRTATTTASAESGLAAALAKEIRRLQRRLEAIGRDVDREQEAGVLRRRAELLSRERLPRRGVSEVTVTAYGPAGPEQVTIALDPALHPREQAEAWFRLAKRYERGAELGRARAAETRLRMAELQALADQVTDAPEGSAALAAIAQDPRLAHLFRRSTGARDPGTRKSTAHRLPYREFRTDTGAAIWVGRGAKDNDALTTRHARPQDLFLHVRDAPSAHVIVPRNKGSIVPPELLLDAATLAHHFSSLVADAHSDIAYTERRFVQKRRGSPPGTVQLLRHKVLRLTYARDRALRLVAREVRPTQ